MEKSRLIKVINKFSGSVGYDVPDLGVYRNFQPRESKDITIEELEKLSYIPGGLTILREYLEITDADIAEKILNGKLEPEYFYTEEDMAVNLPLNDIAKREAIKEKLDFDVTRAIEIKNTNFDGGDAASSDEPTQAKRRVATKTTSTTAAGRRVKSATE